MGSSMTTEAERLAEVFETFGQDHNPSDWPAVQQHFLSDAAALLRSQAAEIERLKALTETLRQEAAIHAQEARTANATIAEIYKLCTGSTGEPGNWNGAKPVREAFDKANTLLRQALESLVESRDDVALCLAHDEQFAGHERYNKRIAFYKEQLARHDAAIAAIKQHLGEV